MDIARLRKIIDRNHVGVQPLDARAPWICQKRLKPELQRKPGAVQLNAFRHRSELVCSNIFSYQDSWIRSLK